MARPKSLGSYVPLSASYYLDDAVMEAGERAELLFVRGLAFLAQADSDGFISNRQISVLGIGMRDASARAKRLVDVGLWQEVDGGYVVRSWLKWNKSAADIGRLRKQDRERKATDNDGVRALVDARDGWRCQYCSSSSDLCIDHLRPQSLGGGHDPSNLQTLCRPCNSRKGVANSTGMTLEQCRSTFGGTYGMAAGFQ